MYIPPHFEEKDPETLRALVRAHPLGAWVTNSLVVNHIPFLLKGATLVGHVSRANDVWKSLQGESVVIFQGPEAYITPSWYAAKKEHGKVVPTWNYAVVHVHGTPRAIEDRDWLLGLVTELTDTHEARETKPWKVTDAPADYVQAQLKGIVGIEIGIRAMVGKWKASQNRSAADRAGVVEGLRERGDAGSAALAAPQQKHPENDQP